MAIEGSREISVRIFNHKNNKINYVLFFKIILQKIFDKRFYKLSASENFVECGTIVSNVRWWRIDEINVHPVTDFVEF